MHFRCLVWLCLLLSQGVVLTGCGGWGGEAESEVDLDADLEALTGSAAEFSTAMMESGLPPSDELRLGEEFPLLKTVEQNLIQFSPQGETTCQSQLEVLLSIVAEELPQSGARKGQRRMGVRYDRVRYHQDIGGKAIDYDSQAAQPPLPAEVQLYHGLAGNGFFFWMGDKLQLLELSGFEEFLNRCVRQVSPERQQELRAALVVASGGDGLSSFVDESIGILPPKELKVGDTWSLTREVHEPLRMLVTTQYTVQKIDAGVVEVGILGTIAPNAGYGAIEQIASGVNVTLRGGRSYGSCLIDRRTGLPRHSRIEHSLDMSVQLPDGQEFEQRKQTVLTLREVPPESRQPSPAAGSAPGTVPGAPATGSAGLGTAPSAFAESPRGGYGRPTPSATGN